MSKIVLVTGNEPYRIKCELDRVKKDSDVSEYYGLTSEVYEDCRQMSLFFSKKAVIVWMTNNPDAEAFMNYVKHPGSADLYLVAPDVDKRSAVYKTCKSGKHACQILTLDKVPKDKFDAMCASMIQRRGCVVRKSTVDWLYEYTGYGVNEKCDLFEISIVIKQMCYQAGEGGEVTPDMVRNFATPYEDAVIWNLSEVLFSGSKQKVLALGEQLLKDGENPIAMLSALLRQFRLAYKAKVIGGSGKDLSSKLGVQMFRLRKALSYNEAVLSEVLGMLQKRVNQIKNGSDPKAVFRVALCETMLTLNG